MTLKIESLLHERDVAEMLKVSPFLLQKWRCYKNGGPAWVVVGSRSVRYKHSDVLAYIEANRVEV